MVKVPFIIWGIFLRETSPSPATATVTSTNTDPLRIGIISPFTKNPPGQASGGIFFGILDKKGETVRVVIRGNLPFVILLLSLHSLALLQPLPGFPPGC